jgi:hypothetical protein
MNRLKEVPIAEILHLFHDEYQTFQDKAYYLLIALEPGESASYIKFHKAVQHFQVTDISRMSRVPPQNAVMLYSDVSST